MPGGPASECLRRATHHMCLREGSKPDGRDAKRHGSREARSATSGRVPHAESQRNDAPAPQAFGRTTNTERDYGMTQKANTNWRCAWRCFTILTNGCAGHRRTAG